MKRGIEGRTPLTYDTALKVTTMENYGVQEVNDLPAQYAKIKPTSGHFKYVE